MNKINNDSYKVDKFLYKILLFKIKTNKIITISKNIS